MSLINEQIVRDEFRRRYSHLNQLDSERHAPPSTQLPGAGCQLTVVDTLPSTNAYLMDLAKNPDEIEQQLPHCCIAATQTAGVGRRGRSWLSGSDSITFSLLNQLSLDARQLSGLSLVTGIAVAECLQPESTQQLSLKWPNDVLVDGHKLCGILTELPKIGDENALVVTGIGVNYRHNALHDDIDRPVTTLAQLADPSTEPLPREKVIGQLMAHVLAAHQQFVHEGWTAFADRYRQRDALLGKKVWIEQGQTTIGGTAQGVANDGSLKVDIDGQVRTFTAGEVSLHRNRNPL